MKCLQSQVSGVERMIAVVLMEGYRERLKAFICGHLCQIASDNGKSGKGGKK